MTNIQLRTVNNALAERGVKERLFKGNGYLYFSGGNAHKWHSSMVCVYKLNHLTLDQWLNEWKMLSGNSKFPLEK